MENSLSAQSPSRDLRFSITSGLLKTYQTADGQKRLKTVASSTIRDRGGDVMTENAIRRMADSARQNMTIFLNHSYSVPEDVFGSVEDVQVVRRGDVWDLEFDVRLNDSNPRAVKTYEAIENGTKLGTSIGARIREDGAARDKSTGGWVFDDIELLEASIVGIPANPRSWVQHAIKALEPDETKAKVWVEQDSSGNVSITVDTDSEDEAEETEETKSDPVIGEVDEDGNEVVAVIELSEEESALIESGSTLATETTLDAGPELDVLDAEPSTAQEGQPTAPETASVGETPEVITEGLEPEVLDVIKSEDFAGLLDLLKSATRELVETRKALAAASAAKVEAEGERDRAKDDLATAREIIDQIADLPIGRRSGFDDGVREFRTKFSNLYGEDFLKMLENKNGV